MRTLQKYVSEAKTKKIIPDTFSISSYSSWNDVFKVRINGIIYRWEFYDTEDRQEIVDNTMSRWERSHNLKWTIRYLKEFARPIDPLPPEISYDSETKVVRCKDCGYEEQIRPGLVGAQCPNCDVGTLGLE